MGSPGRASRRLAALASPLKPNCEPYYVRRPVSPGLERAFPADGWYWIPAGHPVAVFLGASFEIAAHELHTLIGIETEQQPAALAIASTSDAPSAGWR